ncbi:MAG TPA: aminotransferase class III-fold pyridoxal phosphate-dependent enzyme [Solirubrobacterales bacterium]|nr:aminotransferase class III-fold pyridoxal phosphate-dependent enzyme [Solirubrobacterales bacterium]
MNETLAQVERHFSPGAALSAKVIGGGAVEVAASGAVVTLSDGRELLDFGSYAVTLLGHRHPIVLAAVAGGLGAMPTATRSLANPATAAFAAELSERCGDGLQRVWLGSDGADAVEAALKLARRASGRTRVLAVEGGFHGKTLGALALTRNPRFRQGLEPLLGAVTELPRGDPEAVRREAAAGDVAALVLEPIQGEAGVHVLDPTILARWAADARAAGAFLVSDEIQAGLRRAGPFSPSLAAGLEPDAVLFGKALGGGLMPISALVAGEALAAPLVADPSWHSATFGGHPLACAAGRAALVAIEAEVENGRAIAATLGAGLRELGAAHPESVVAIRGSGLIWGVELASPGAAGAALIGLAQRGLLVSPCLSSASTVRLLPPMVTSPEQAAAALAILAATLPELEPYVG